MIIESTNLLSLKYKHPNERIGFTTGAFHLLHPGHVYFLNRCKKFCDVLVVAVAHDEITKHKRPTYLDTTQREFLVDNLKSVDYTVSEDVAMPPENVKTLVSMLDPDIWITNSDNPNLELYRKLRNDILVLERNTYGMYDISTTEIIRRIRHGYDKR